MKILKVRPYFSEKIWGGQKLNELGFSISKDKKIGEAWLISAHQNGMCYVESNTKNEFISLKDFFEKQRDLFGNYVGDYPLLVKILTPTDNLSVQVHPDDAYAKKHHNTFGKPESWYIIDAPKHAQLIYGHNAKTKSELIDQVNNEDWDKLLNKVNVKKGDFLNVPPGKIHAVQPNVVVYELQRSSDITYRFYDYDRYDEHTNKKRELNIQDAINNTNIPDTDDIIIHNANKTIFSSKYFSLYKLDSKIKSEFVCPEKTGWLQLTVIKGKGNINGIKFNTMESAIAIDGVDKIIVNGEMEVLFSWVRK